MQDISPRVPLVRCPKCGQLLPELPLYAVYSCGGCGALFRAKKRSSVDDGLSEKSWEERIDEVSGREGYADYVGFGSSRGSDRSPISSRVSQSPLNSPLRGSDSVDLGSGRQSPLYSPITKIAYPIRRGDFDMQSKSSGRSIDGDSGSMESVVLDEHPRLKPYHMNYNHLRGRFANERYMDDIYSFPPLPNEVPFANESASGSRFLYSTPPNPSSRSRRSVYNRTDGGGSVQKHGKGLLTVKKHHLCCHPIAGAAPFVLCYNCFQLLRVPRKLITMKNTQLSQFRLQCGSCRTTLSFSFDKKPRASMPLQPDPSLTIVDDVPSKMSESDHKISHPIAPADITKRESYEIGPHGYTFQSTDSEMSQNSTDVCIKNDGDGNKIGKSSPSGMIPGAFRDLSQPTNTSNAKADVFVNGQPLPNRVVRRAEKRAGPISPGKYWYDYRAGFWGEMGSYCLGIIPPFIEEFEFPMSVNCAGGTTAIYVNGRELHEKDLKLLARRQFPLTRNRWYIMDISGKVEDEETHIVVNIGKLAPTLEKANQGSGMSSSKMQE